MYIIAYYFAGMTTINQAKIHQQLKKGKREGERKEGKEKKEKNGITINSIRTLPL